MRGLRKEVLFHWIKHMDLTERYGLGGRAVSIKEDEWQRKQISEAHKSLSRSIKDFEQVSKLLRGHSVQVNIADKQVIQNATV